MAASVSVVIPCYNAAVFLPETVGSLMRQSTLPSEIIVVDDGSTDESAQIAESFGPPVRVIRQKNQGESAARNCGIAASSSKYLLFLDADDLLKEQSVELLVHAIGDREDAVACMGYAHFRESPSETTLEQVPEHQTLLPRILFENFAPIHSWMVPRRMVERANGFSDDISVHEDWALWQRVAVLGAELLIVPYIGALYRRHAGSQTSRVTNRSMAPDVVARATQTCELVLMDQTVIDKHGEAVFLMAAEALFKGENNKVSTEELGLLRRQIVKLARHAAVRRGKTRYAKIAGLLGFNLAYWLFTTKIRMLRQNYTGR